MLAGMVIAASPTLAAEVTSERLTNADREPQKGVLYKIDVTSGSAGRIVWTMDPKQDRPLMNRGAALWGNLVISVAN